jgi:hypothetical protein
MESVKRMRGTGFVGSQHLESKPMTSSFSRQGYWHFARAADRESDISKSEKY